MTYRYPLHFFHSSSLIRPQPAPIPIYRDNSTASAVFYFCGRLLSVTRLPDCVISYLSFTLTDEALGAIIEDNSGLLKREYP